MSSPDSKQYRTFLANRRFELLERVARAAKRAGREPSEVQVLAVSKTVGSEEVSLAHEVGYRLFGENRPQELKRKVMAARENASMKDVEFHMIGNLQKNKINQVLGNATVIHSVSSVHLAEAIDRRAQTRCETVRCLLEVNVSGEASKSGLSVDEVRKSIDSMLGLENICLEGLMTMAPANDLATARVTFSGLRELRDELRVATGLELPVLSCGMSGDFEVAVEEGSTLVRLGRIVFDPAYKSV